MSESNDSFLKTFQLFSFSRAPKGTCTLHNHLHRQENYAFSSVLILTLEMRRKPGEIN